jgi:hypothetical protein
VDRRLSPLEARPIASSVRLLNAVVAQNHGSSHFLVRGGAAGAYEAIAKAAGGPPAALAPGLDGVLLDGSPVTRAARGLGARRLDAQGETRLWAAPVAHPRRAVVSRSHLTPETSALLSRLGITETLSRDSSLRRCAPSPKAPPTSTPASAPRCCGTRPPAPRSHWRPAARWSLWTAARCGTSWLTVSATLASSSALRVAWGPRVSGPSAPGVGCAGYPHRTRGRAPRNIGARSRVASAP